LLQILKIQQQEHSVEMPEHLNNTVVPANPLIHYLRFTAAQEKNLKVKEINSS
jgi:hypothetical protein